MRSNPSRAIRASVALTLLTALTAIAAPVAQAAQPSRDVIYGSPFSIPAGFGCAFDVTASPHPGTQARITYFDDGREVRNAHGGATFTNADTGATFEHRARFHSTDAYDPQTNEIVTAVDGQLIMNFWSGDQGPYGEVGSTGAFYRFTGRIEYRVDVDTFAITYFSSSGRVEDICAALS